MALDTVLNSHYMCIQEQRPACIGQGEPHER